MHKKVKKFYTGTWGGGVNLTTPGMQNTGFDLLQQLGALDMSQIARTDYARDVGYPRIKPASTVTDSKATGQTTSPSTFQSGGTDGGNTSKTPFSQTKAGKGVAMAGQAMNMFGDALSNTGLADYKENGNTETRKNISAAGRQVASMFGPWGMLAAGADSVVEALGGKSDVSEGLGTANDIGNMVASITLPGLGWALGKTDKYSQDEMIKNSSAYTGEIAAGEKVSKNAGAKILLGRGTANENTRLQKLRDTNTKLVLQQGRDQMMASNYQGTSIGNQMTLSGGPKTLRVKEGAKLSLQKAREILKNQEVAQVVEVCEVFKEGGKVNVIPDGHLHVNRHHMEDIGDEYKDLTTKGIPVVTEDGGELVQQAEIERNEIIFNIDVTKRLEALMGDGSDEAALEAGKLLAFEIMENTIDNTGLIDEIS